MTQRPVFDEPASPRTTSLAPTEPRVNWFLESTRPEAAEGRWVVNDLYSRFPDPEGGLRDKLRSTNAAAHHALRGVRGPPVERDAERPAHGEVDRTGARRATREPGRAAGQPFRCAGEDLLNEDGGDRRPVPPAAPGLRRRRKQACRARRRADRGVHQTRTRLRDRLDSKAGKYDLRGGPFAIVAGLRDRCAT